MTTLILQPIYHYTSDAHAKHLHSIEEAAKARSVPVYWIKDAYQLKQDLPELLARGDVAYYGDDRAWPYWFKEEVGLCVPQLHEKWFNNLPKKYTSTEDFEPKFMRLDAVEKRGIKAYLYPEKEFDENDPNTPILKPGIYKKQDIIDAYDWVDSKQFVYVYLTDCIPEFRKNKTIYADKNKNIGGRYPKIINEFLSDPKVTFPCGLALRIATYQARWFLRSARPAWNIDITHRIPSAALNAILDCPLRKNLLHDGL